VPSLRAVILTYGKASRQHGRRIAEAFPAPQVDLYGSTEAGYLFVGEAFRDNSRAIDDNAFIELVPWRPERPDVHQIHVTTRGREAMPLLRYHTGDIVQSMPGRVPDPGPRARPVFQARRLAVSAEDVDAALPEIFACWHYSSPRPARAAGISTMWRTRIRRPRRARGGAFRAPRPGVRVNAFRRKSIAPAASGKFALLKPLARLIRGLRSALRRLILGASSPRPAGLYSVRDPCPPKQERFTSAMVGAPRLDLFGRIFFSTIGSKLIMAVTGVVLILFVVGHLSATSRCSRTRTGSTATRISCSRWAHALGSCGSSCSSASLHIWAATSSRSKTGAPAATSPTAVNTWIQATFASRYMRWTGYIVLAFILYHLAQFTWASRSRHVQGEHPHYTMRGDYRSSGFTVVRAGTEVLDVAAW
jgi:hypothetical protein